MKYFYTLFIFLSLSFISIKTAKAEHKNTDYFDLSIISNESAYGNKFDKRSLSSLFVVKADYYDKARKYFTARKRPIHHFLDMGVGAVLIESFYPFETTAYPFFVYFNYRKEKWGQIKIPVIFSIQYEALFNKRNPHRIHTLLGVRYPTSHDLSLFHVELMSGISFPLNPISKQDKIALEFRLLFTHIIGPKASPNRLYFQWGAKARLKQRLQPGLIIQIGLDNHL